MLLTKYTPVPSGMSFVLDTGPAPRSAYRVSTPGAAAVVTLQGTGIWTVEILKSVDGVEFTVLTTKTRPGQWRFDVQALNTLAVRVSAYTSGILTGMLTHGGAAPITNVSGMFGSYLIFSYNSTPTEPPVGNQLRANSATVTTVTKLWLSNTDTAGNDQFQAVRKIPVGGTVMVQDRDNHLHAVLFTVAGPIVDKTNYVEVPVLYQEHQGTLSSSQVMVAVFNPGPAISLNPLIVTQLPAIPPRTDPPVLTSLDPVAAPLGSPDFTLHVQGTGFVDSDVIEWNGGIEPTTFVSDTELTTGVNMATAAVVMPIPIVVVTPEGLRSNTLTFELGGYPPAPPPEPEPEQVFRRRRTPPEGD